MTKFFTFKFFIRKLRSDNFAYLDDKHRFKKVAKNVDDGRQIGIWYFGKLLIDCQLLSMLPLNSRLFSQAQSLIIVYMLRLKMNVMRNATISISLK